MPKGIIRPGRRAAGVLAFVSILVSAVPLPAPADASPVVRRTAPYDFGCLGGCYATTEVDTGAWEPAKQGVLQVTPVPYPVVYWGFYPGVGVTIGYVAATSGINVFPSTNTTVTASATVRGAGIQQTSTSPNFVCLNVSRGTRREASMCSRVSPDETTLSIAGAELVGGAKYAISVSTTCFGDWVVTWCGHRRAGVVSVDSLTYEMGVEAAPAAPSRVETGAIQIPTANVARVHRCASGNAFLSDRAQGVTGWMIAPTPGTRFDLRAADGSSDFDVVFYPDLAACHANAEVAGHHPGPGDEAGSVPENATTAIITLDDGAPGASFTYREWDQTGASA